MPKRHRRQAYTASGLHPNTKVPEAHLKQGLGGKSSLLMTMTGATQKNEVVCAVSALKQPVQGKPNLFFLISKKTKLPAGLGLDGTFFCCERRFEERLITCSELSEYHERLIETKTIRNGASQLFWF